MRPCDLLRTDQRENPLGSEAAARCLSLYNWLLPVYLLAPVGLLWACEGSQQYGWYEPGHLMPLAGTQLHVSQLLTILLVFTVSAIGLNRWIQIADTFLRLIPTHHRSTWLCVVAAGSVYVMVCSLIVLCAISTDGIGTLTGALLLAGAGVSFVVLLIVVGDCDFHECYLDALGDYRMSKDRSSLSRHASVLTTASFLLAVFRHFMQFVPSSVMNTVMSDFDHGDRQRAICCPAGYHLALSLFTLCVLIQVSLAK